MKGGRFKNVSLRCAVKLLQRRTTSYCVSVIATFCTSHYFLLKFCSGVCRCVLESLQQARMTATWVSRALALSCCHDCIPSARTAHSIMQSGCSNAFKSSLFPFPTLFPLASPLSIARLMSSARNIISEELSGSTEKELMQKKKEKERSACQIGRAHV